MVQDYYSDNEEMLAKLAAGAAGYDLLVPTGNAVEALLRSRHAAARWTRRASPNLANIKPEFRNAFFDPGNRYSVPYAYTVTLLGYNAQRRLRALNLPTDTWALIFEPRYLAKLRGRVTVLDSQRELMAAAMRYLGYSVKETDAAQWNEARRLILRAKPYWAAFSQQSYIKELTVGNIWVAHGYSNDMFQARRMREGQTAVPHRLLDPEGRRRAGGRVLVLHKSGRHPELAPASSTSCSKGGTRPNHQPDRLRQPQCAAIATSAPTSPAIPPSSRRPTTSAARNAARFRPRPAPPPLAPLDRDQGALIRRYQVHVPGTCTWYELPAGGGGENSPARRDDRVAEGGALLRRYVGLNPYRGFESLSLRQNPDL